MPSPIPSLCRRLLETPASRPGELRSICQQLYDNLAGPAAALLDGAPARAHLPAGQGTAIGSTWAALCIMDFARTRQFAEGLVEAIRCLLGPGRRAPVHVLYAGCGPFATLALPAMAAFTPDQVRFTLLDLNPASLAMAAATLAELGWLSFVREGLLVDACLCRLGAAADADILLSETLNAGLRNEPFVPILMNLVPQLPPGVVLVPEEVRISAALIDESRRKAIKLGAGDGPPCSLDLGPVLTVNRSTAGQWAALAAAGAEPFPAVELPLPAERMRFHQLALVTDLTVQGRCRLPPDASGLTLSWKFRSLDQVGAERRVARFRYRTGDEPGFLAEFT